ncbi:MAG: CRISPR-associated RAMP protein [Candidatus Poribacteria bacterium]|nr:MAG: CRISPR-associated RAMP protein [Candidatus Poribacteria bacterium]
MSSFFSFENRWIVDGTLQMRTALSIGSRVSLMPAGSDLPVMKTPEGVPLIPGSSIKGVVRSHLEQLLRALDSLDRRLHGVRLWACDPLDEQQRCVSAKRKDELHQAAQEVAREQSVEVDKVFAQKLWEESCTACRLFGSPWMASRVSFQDALLQNQEDLPHWTEVRDGVGIDRDLGSAKAGIKYDFETVPAGSQFRIRVVVENASEEEVGLLLFALESLRRGELPVGGKTTRGVGWGELVELRVRRFDKARLVDLLAGRDPYEEIPAGQALQRLSAAIG